MNLTLRYFRAGTDGEGSWPWPRPHVRASRGSQEEASPSWVSGQGSCDLKESCTHLEPSSYGLVTHVVATEQTEGVREGRQGRGTQANRTGLTLAMGVPATAWRCEQPVALVQVPWQDTVGPSCLHRDSEEDTELSCARGGCLASRVASCSCELLTDGRRGQSRLGGWRAGWEGAVWPDRQTGFSLATSPAGDLPRPPETTAAVVTAPHSRAREAIGESLVHVPLEAFLETLESSGGSGSDSNNTGAGARPSCCHRHPQALPKPFPNLRSCDFSSHWVLYPAAR